MPSTFDHFRQGLGPEELREDHGRLAGRIIEIEGNAVAPMLSEETADLRIAICPVADERNNTGALKRIFGGLCIDPDLVVDFASETPVRCKVDENRSEEHTSELQSLMRISYAVFCLKKQKK